ncbi:MAG: hypothetical protein AAGA48_10025 [Myxococcota bacterium]
MKSGDVLADRWRLETVLQTRDGIARWRATDQHSGTDVEVLSLTPGRSSDADRRAFLETHRIMRDSEVEGTVPTIALHPGDPGPFAVRPALSSQTLADLRAPLDAHIVAAIGVALLPAVAASGGASRGALLMSDVALDEDGRSVLAFRGTPLNQVIRGTTRAVAPEVLAGRGPDAASGLFGLGVALYRLATGREPDLGKAGVPPAPPSAVRHGVPAALDDGILRLLSSDPSERAGALPSLQEAAGDTVHPDLRGYAKPAAVLGEVKVTTSRSSSATNGRSARHETPRAMAMVPHQTLKGLDPEQRHAIAGATEVSLDVIDQVVARQWPLVVGGFPLRAEAVRESRRLTELSGVPVHAGVAGAGRALWLPLIATLAIGAPLALVTLGLMIAQVWWLAVPMAGALAIDVVIAAATWLWLRSRATDWSNANEAWRLVADHRDQRETYGLKPVSDDLAALRRQLAQAELPPAAASDLRSVLKEVDARIDALHERAEAASGALRQVDSAGLETRLGLLQGKAGLTEAETAERDRLSRILADLDDVKGRQRSVHEEASRLRDALAEVAAVLGQLGDEVSDDALAALGKGARHIEAAARPSEREELRQRQLAQRQAERNS